MKRRRTLVAALASGVMLVQAAHTLTEGASQGIASVPKGWRFSFPDGDPKAGKTVFMNMQCYSCHAIKVPEEKLPADTGGIGPDLSGYSALPKEYLAESIIKAHTVVAAPGYVVKEGKAAMGNYNHFHDDPRDDRYRGIFEAWCGKALMTDSWRGKFFGANDAMRAW